VRGGAARPPVDTRRRILDSAVRLFAERGYAGTSVRDIADELAITKAAVHYHFAAKDQIVAALLEPMLHQFGTVLDEAAARAYDPRGLLLGVRDVLLESGPLLSVLGNDPSLGAPNRELHERVVALETRAAQLLAGPEGGPHQLLRARCALVAFLAGWKARSGAPPAGAPDAGAPDAVELEVVLAAALAVLGGPARQLLRTLSA